MLFINRTLPQEYLKQLYTWGHDVITLPEDSRLPFPVSSHPDMLLFLTDRTLITDQTYYHEMAQRELDSACKHGNLTLQLTDEAPSQQYPHDIRFNALQIGRHLFCHPTHTSRAISAQAKREHWNVIPTKQGYARCSACPIGTSALITADPSIAAAAKKHDLEVCNIHQGHVLLPGYPHGFIGGCCGAYGNRLFFCGDPLLHPDGEYLLSFVRSHGMTPITMPGLPLFDAGSLIFF